MPRINLSGPDIVSATLEKDPTKSESEGLVELYRRLRPGELPTEEAVKQHLKNLFFDSRRYDLARVGRYKFNKRLCIANRVIGLQAFADIINEDGELLVKAGEVISEAQATAIMNSGINTVDVKGADVTDQDIVVEVVKRGV